MSEPSPTLPPVSDAAIVPVRGFDDAKQRLAMILNPEERRHLAWSLADGVLAALGDLPTYVVTDDPEVADLARQHQATVLADPGDGLSPAVAAAQFAAAADGHERLMVTHADLPFPGELPSLLVDHSPDHVVLVPDRRDDGTNVLVLPAALRFRVAYGPGSFRRHLAEARRLGAVTQVAAVAQLGWDVDLPEDLATPPAWGPPAWTTSPT